MRTRDLDIVVLGASGAAGARTAQYVAARAAETGVRWAAAGRNRAAIERRLAELDASSPEVIPASVENRASLASLAARTKVILNAAGPYTANAPPVIEACIEAGAHYLDLTGEIAHVRRMVELWHDRAAAAGVQVVQVCGFESLPPDLAVLLAAEIALERWHEPVAEVDLEASVTPPPGRPRPSDWLSNGTRQSMLAVCRGEDPSVIAEPGALVLDPAARRAIDLASPIQLRARRASSRWVAPLPPAFINPAVIHRTAALIAAEQARALQPFRYREGVALSGGLTGAVAAGAIVLPLAAIRSAARARPAARRAGANLLEALFAKLGPGPTDDRLHGWTWTMTVEAVTRNRNSIRVSVEGDGHPGYLSTAAMFGEAGLMLAEPGAAADRAGCLTPATALGTGSIARLERAGLRFTVGEPAGSGEAATRPPRARA